MTSHSFAELAGKIGKIPDELNRSARRGVSQAALLTTNEIRTQVRLVTGGDMRLSGVGRRGARVGARYDVKGTVNPTALIRATGPMQLIERNTREHDIAPRRRRRGGGGRVLKFADGTYRLRAHHPGTTGRHPFKRGVALAEPRTRDVFRRELATAVPRAMR